MPTTQSRIAAVLEPPVFKAVEKLARRDGVSLSQEVRDLVVRALELMEDAELAAVAGKRLRDIRRPGVKWVSHAEVKRRLGAV